MNEHRNIPDSEQELPFTGERVGSLGGDETNRSDDRAIGPQGRQKSGLGLGLERIGEYAIARPKQGLVAIVILSLIALFGVSLINVDDSLTELFRTNTQEIKKYETLTERFPASEYDVLIVIEHENML